MVPGDISVLIVGIKMMQKLFVGNWDTLQLVSYFLIKSNLYMGQWLSINYRLIV